MQLFQWLQPFHKDDNSCTVGVNYNSYNKNNNVARDTKKREIHNILIATKYYYICM